MTIATRSIIFGGIGRAAQRYVLVRYIYNVGDGKPVPYGNIKSPR